MQKFLYQWPNEARLCDRPNVECTLGLGEK